MSKVDFTVECRTSKAGKNFVCLVAHMHWGEKLIFLDKASICELLNFAPSEYNALKSGDIINLTKGE